MKAVIQELITSPDYGGLKDLADRIVGLITDTNIEALVDREKPVYSGEVKGLIGQFRQVAEKHISELPKTDEELYEKVILSMR